MKKSQKKHMKKYKPASLDPFESAVIQILSGNVILKESKDGGFALFNKENIPVSFAVQDNVLQISQDKAGGKENLTVSMPARHSLKTLQVMIKDGDLVCKNLKAGKAEIQLEDGSLTLNKVNFAAGSAKISHGRLSAKGDILQQFTFEMSGKAPKEVKTETEESE